MSLVERKDTNEQRKSPADIMIEISASLYPPLPEPPEGSTWVGKERELMTDDEKRAATEFALQIQRILTGQLIKTPPRDHPRYAEYLHARREYESMFTVSVLDSLQEFNI